jgi:hypothetical protein
METAMTNRLDELLKQAKASAAKMSPEEKEAQRRSFAYGNTNIENPLITREMVDEEAERLEKNGG